jgi:ABC-2 type transport system permease protein
MSRALLVAAREYRQIAATRGFWVVLLMIPLMLAVSQFAGRFVTPQTSVAYVLVDASGQYAPAIQHRMELSYQRTVLGDLATYVQKWKVGSAAPGAVWASGPRWFSDTDAEAFLNQGGLPAALRQIAPHLPADAQPFKAATPRPYVAVDPPAGVPVDKGPDAFGAAMAGPLQGDVVTAAGKRPLTLAVYIPRDFGASADPVRVWSNGRWTGPLIDAIRAELTGRLRAQALQASGLSPAAFTRIESLAAPMTVATPPEGRGRAQVVVRSLLPLALVYLLLITVMVTGAMMLQGVIEERSNKLMESVLACVRPSELMYGKLLGIGGVGLTTVAFWAACAVAAAFFAAQGMAADFLKPSLVALNHPWIWGAMGFYFLAGYLVVSMIYLGIGALSDSMQDAQAYLMPVVAVIMLPTVLMMVATTQNPNGVLPHVLSWIPIYTPFAMLARLGSGVSQAEVLGTGAMLIVFMAAELYLLGRLFQVSLLRTGQPLKLSGVIHLIRQSEAG